MIIALVSQKGGVGKSTLAAAFAWELHRRRQRVLVVDADPQGTVRVTGEIATEKGQEAPTIVAMGKDLHRPDQLPRISQAFDHCIIDTPGRHGAIMRAALMVADVALIPSGQSAADAWGILETIELVQQAQVIRPQLASALVITRKAPRTKLGQSAREVLEEAGFPVLQAEATFRVAWQESLAAGQGVTVYAPHDKAAEEACAILDEALALTANVEEAANA